MKTTLRMLFTTLALTIGNTTASAQTMDSKTLTLEGAKLVIEAAKAEARRVAAPGAVIAVVDNGGSLIALERLDGTFAAGANLSIGKARSASLSKRPTKEQGGVPILVGSEVVGAVGVSGAASAQQDEDLAVAGAKGITRATKPVAVSYFEKEKVEAGFAKGTVLFDGDKYQVHASRRDKAGVVEIHEKDADIMYVISGTATLVTGGEPVNVSTVSPGEIRATDIKGGETRQLARGDVIVIPAGTPHWFKEVPGPLTYYVVKAR